MNAFIRLLVRNGVRRGVVGGSRPWLILGGVGLTWRILRRLSGKEPEVVYSEELLAGQTLVIAHGRDAKLKG